MNAMIDIQITDLNEQGQGLGRIDGQVVFVDGAIPGDQVRLQQLVARGTYAIGQLDQILEPSPDRISPFCPLADRCGGCALQPMRYGAQLEHKRQQVVQLLARIGRVPDAESKVTATLGMDHPYHYRCKIQFPVRGTFDNPQIGFFARRSHAVVDGSTCDVGHPVGDLVRSCVRDYIQQYRVRPYDEDRHQGSLRHVVVRVARRTGQVLVVLVSRTKQLPATAELARQLSDTLAKLPPQPDDFSPDLPADKRLYTLGSLVLNHQPAKTNVIMGPGQTILAGGSFIEEDLLGMRFQISPHSFFQVNPAQAEVLYNQAIALAQLDPDDLALDLYCGTGTIALALAQKAGSVIGVESVAPAIADAKINASRNGYANVQFEVAQAEDWLGDFIATSPVLPTVAVIDPPRRGCDRSLLEALRHVPLKRLVYVSCNPATLARDVQILAPDYQVRQVVPVDMFPWTDSIECVCLLDRI
ncbi:MAG: 23S rRNA (uracil(1939)-C(5))-methyltransferase RlmD [Clostridia bacterium]|nr:23S rRNA (uracil(1939)-C(5))-methyltransferase RlmD [Clostridia bacterium]